MPRIRLVDTSYYADYGATSFPNAFPAGAAAPPPTRVARASYTGSHTTNLIYKPDLNQVAPKTIGYAALVATPSLRAANLKYPNFRKVLTRDNGPSDKYNALTAELNRRFSSDLTLSNHYTWTKNIANALGAAPASAIPGGGQGDNVLNIANIAADSGNALYSRRHRFVSTFVYDFPFGRAPARRSEYDETPSNVLQCSYTAKRFFRACGKTPRCFILEGRSISTLPMGSRWPTTICFTSPNCSASGSTT